MRNTGYGKYIDADRIVLFTQPPGQGKPRLSFLRDLLADLPQNQSLVLFDQASGSDVAQPAATVLRVDTPTNPAALMDERNRDAAPREHAVVLRAGQGEETPPLVWLRDALVLKRIPWEGGSVDGSYRPPVREIFNKLAARNQCAAQESNMPDGVAKCVARRSCAGGTEIWLCGIDDMGHQWAGAKEITPLLLGKGTTGYVASLRIVQFFQSR